MWRNVKKCEEMWRNVKSMKKCEEMWKVWRSMSICEYRCIYSAIRLSNYEVWIHVSSVKKCEYMWRSVIICEYIWRNVKQMWVYVKKLWIYVNKCEYMWVYESAWSERIHIWVNVNLYLNIFDYYNWIDLNICDYAFTWKRAIFTSCRCELYIHICSHIFFPWWKNSESNKKISCLFRIKIRDPPWPQLSPGLKRSRPRGM
jgi:hypothetical protein